MGKIEQKTLPQWKQEGNKIPGFGENRLTKTNVRLNSGGGEFKIGQFNITTTGNLSITGVGFKPKLVKFELVHNTSGFGSGNITEVSQNSTSFYVGASNTRCIDIYNNLGVLQARAVYVSMDVDGFTINVQNINPTLVVNYTCFG